MKTTKKITGQTIVLTEPYRLSVKFAPRVFIPMCAVDPRWMHLAPKSHVDWRLRNNALFVTNDLKYVRMEIQAVYDNEGDKFLDEFETICKDLYNMSYTEILAVWKSRFYDVGRYWYIIDMVEDGNFDASNNG